MGYRWARSPARSTDRAESTRRKVTPTSIIHNVAAHPSESSKAPGPAVLIFALALQVAAPPAPPPMAGAGETPEYWRSLQPIMFSTRGRVVCRDTGAISAEFTYRDGRVSTVAITGLAHASQIGAHRARHRTPRDRLPRSSVHRLRRAERSHNGDCPAVSR